MKYLIALISGILISNTADIYCRIKFEKWTEMYKGHSIGMPYTWDMCLGEFIARPIDKFADNNILCGYEE